MMSAGLYGNGYNSSDDDWSDCDDDNDDDDDEEPYPFTGLRRKAGKHSMTCSLSQCGHSLF